MKRFLSLLFILAVALPAFATGNDLFVSATSMGASFNSSDINVFDNRALSVQAVVSSASSPVGTFKLQASNDGTNYTDVTGSDVSVSAAGSFMWNVVDPAYKKLRLVYTRTSGSATCDARVELKGVPHP